jgi:hypothetical protein
MRSETDFSDFKVNIQHFSKDRWLESFVYRKKKLYKVKDHKCRLNEWLKEENYRPKLEQFYERMIAQKDNRI